MDAKKIRVQKKEYISAVGRRREAIARVRLHTNGKNEINWNDIVLKPGTVYVNGMEADVYFGSEVGKGAYLEVFKATDAVGKYTATVKVSGGGKSGQLVAMTLGLANALSLLDVEKFRPLLKKKGFLTRDSRIRERRTAGKGGKARRKKQSPKR